MSVDDRMVELKLLLTRIFSRNTLYTIGKQLNIPYFHRFGTAWAVSEEDAAFEIASVISDDELKKVFTAFNPRQWAVFRGQYFTFEEGTFTLTSSMKSLQTGVRQTKRRYGKNCDAILQRLINSGKGCSLAEIEKALNPDVDPLPILEMLEKFQVIVTSYRGDNYQEWRVLEETVPLLQLARGITSPPSKAKYVPREKPDYVTSEHKYIQELDRELTEYLNDLLKKRLDTTIAFGKQFHLSALSEYLQELFGKILYFDSFLSIIQQYSLADIQIAHKHGYSGKRTGWNLSLFGEPGTGKSFATRDMILGKPDANIPAHGLPGRNRYAGGITPARFIRIGQAYANRTFNFIVPEFNDWFKYKGMVEPLKLAIERGKIKYETHLEVIGPYYFTSFFSVNYNVATYRRGYEITIQDPNFSAIEDRMLCRMHRLTKQRYVEIAKSQMRLALGEIDIEKGADQIRDQLTLVYAIETKHPLVKTRFQPKPVMLTSQTQEIIQRARDTILNLLPNEVVRFSARLEDHAVRFACAASLLNYFTSDLPFIPVSEEALRYAVQLYIEEAAVRSKEEFDTQDVLHTIF